MQNFNSHKVGLVSGLMLAGWHLIWLGLIFLGLAQPFLDFILRLHSIAPAFTVMPFDPTNSLMLLLVTFVIGYGIGYVGAIVWNKVHRK